MDMQCPRPLAYPVIRVRQHASQLMLQRVELSGFIRVEAWIEIVASWEAHTLVYAPRRVLP